jgi:hypothetical protein
MKNFVRKKKDEKYNLLFENNEESYIQLNYTKIIMHTCICI